MLKIRELYDSEIAKAAELRAEDWGTNEYWSSRITGYLKLELHPQKALDSRVIFVALYDDKIVGLIAGHLTRRFKTEGELQWINVTSSYRHKGIASALLNSMAQWFSKQNAKLICVNVDSENLDGVEFYKKHNAQRLDDHWMVWQDISKLL